MTTQQIIITLLAYAIVLAAAVYFTKPSRRRIAGAAAGGAAAGLVGLGAATLGNAQGWWRVPLPSTFGILALLYICCVVSWMPFLLITWRVALRFGGRGVAICLMVATFAGPLRDYLTAAVFPEWIVFGPGFLPVLFDAAAFFSMLGVGHAIMQLAAGPARSEQRR